MNKKNIYALALNLSLFQTSFSTFLAPVYSENIQMKKRTVAVSYFDNTSNIKELDSLKKGIADMLISDLSKIQSLKIVEREKFQSLIKEIELGKTSYFDPATAQKLGKGLNAEYILTGSYILINDEFRIDARLIRVNTGEIIMSEKSQGLKSEFFDIQKELVETIISKLDINLKREEKSSLREYETKSFKAVESYSKGLDEKDKGNESQAESYFKESLKSDPDYKLAKDALDRLNIIIKKVDEKNEKKYNDFLNKFNLIDFQRDEKLGKIYFDIMYLDLKQERLLKHIELIKFTAKHNLKPYINFGFFKRSSEAMSIIMILDQAKIYEQIYHSTEYENVNNRHFDFIHYMPEISEYLLLKYPNDSVTESTVKGYIYRYQQDLKEMKEYKKVKPDSKYWLEFRKEVQDMINVIKQAKKDFKY